MAIIKRGKKLSGRKRILDGKEVRAIKIYKGSKLVWDNKLVFDIYVNDININDIPNKEITIPATEDQFVLKLTSNKKVNYKIEIV